MVSDEISSRGTKRARLLYGSIDRDVNKRRAQSTIGRKRVILLKLRC
jgi:hypothetical protein